MDMYVSVMLFVLLVLHFIVVHEYKRNILSLKQSRDEKTFLLNRSIVYLKNADKIISYLYRKGPVPSSTLLLKMDLNQIQKAFEFIADDIQELSKSIEENFSQEKVKKEIPTDFEDFSKWTVPNWTWFIDEYRLFSGRPSIENLKV
jgi:hypothetical protein